MEQPQYGVLWDMDGTLIDSTQQHWITWRDSLAAEEYTLTYETFAERYGQRNDTLLRGLLGDDLTDEAIERISERKEQRYRQMVYADGMQLLPGVQYWLDTLRVQGWRQAIVTSAPRANLDTILEVLQLAPFFDTLVSAEDIKRGKPDPEPFLHAAAQLGIAPVHCVVVEDSPAGIEAGRRAGMATIGVLTSQTELDADLVVDRLDQIAADSFARLVERAA